MIVFIIKLSEVGSDRSQDDAVCRRRLVIFLDQGNISKLRRRPQTRFWTWMDSQRILCINHMWTKLKTQIVTKLKNSNCDKIKTNQIVTNWDCSNLNSSDSNSDIF